MIFNIYLQKKGSGILRFTAPADKGSYDFRMNSADDNGVEITSVTFQVSGTLDSKAMAAAIAKTGKLTLYGIQFDFNQATIKPESEPTLKEVGTLLTQDTALRLRIEGHTDNVGKAAYNMELSKKRAESVKAYLISSFQIDAGRLATDGFGDTRPIAKNDTEQGRAQNRRENYRSNARDGLRRPETPAVWDGFILGTIFAAVARFKDLPPGFRYIRSMEKWTPSPSCGIFCKPEI
jgi:outer membrane protein OmpA-like peptidoglycan-associated protein